MKPRYKVNLPRQQAVCDANYLRLLKLMPNLDNSERWVFAVSGQAGSAHDQGVGPKDTSHNVCIEVIERARYTTTVVVSQEAQPEIQCEQAASDTESELSSNAESVSGEGSLLDRWVAPKLTVRLYHDARMAEVIGWQRHRYLKARYEYPNRQMYQSDEKAQFNQFLGEWLSHCLDQGHVVDDLVAPLGMTG